MEFGLVTEIMASFQPLVRNVHGSSTLNYLQKLARLRVVDNSPLGKQAMAEGKPPKIIHVWKHNYKGTIGDKVTVAIKGQVKWGVIVGCVRHQKANIPKFDTNNVVLIEKNGNPMGTRIHVPIPHLLRTILKDKTHKKGTDFTKILAIATSFV